MTTPDDDAANERLATETQLRARKLEALGTLAGRIAHDFHNALQSITGNTALAQRCLEGSHPARAFLDEVAASAARAGDLVQRILTFSQPDEPRHSPISLQGVVADALELTRATLPPHIALHAELADEVPGIVADPGQIEQVVVQLVTNAAQAIGAAGGTIDVWLGTTLLSTPVGSARDLPAGAYAALHVSDDGRGQGAGLGLAVVQGVMKRLGGAVTVRGDVGGGSTFSLYFPTMHAPLDASARRTSSPADARDGRVLFVDDEEVLVSLGTHILEVLGYQVTGTAQPLDALKRFVARPDAYDVVVTDLSMPGLSGLQLAQQLRAVRADLPIILMSGNVGGEELAQARKLGVRELLLKPVGMDDLNRTLARVLAATRRKAGVHIS